ncbi:hypothetical protein BDN70DRAFT_836974 [Pholiota conissans]|uniref:RING-type domain-containing protein n=1 Tax=Pholiota conissans TaxID=109636 RepID=A0A9P5YZA7_9AGAR|nr:hypothetical protein BDN70DRAFT_836974 [Pholiota conissans]
MADTTRGLPLLSGPPPSQDSSSSENACRKCNKEFNVIFARSRKCNHCGYSYCHSCSDYQALMPRTGVDTGYDVMNVCAFCIEFLNITASGKNYLKSLPLAKLKRYINAYNIKIDRAVEKDDLIDAIITARAPNGCLPRSNEHYYRLYSVPNKSQARPRGLFSRSGQTSNAPPPPPPPRQPPSNPHNEFARPDLAPDHPPQPPYPPRSTRPAQQQQYNPPPQPPPRPHSAYPHSSPHNPPPQFHTPPPHGYYQQPQATQNPYGRPPPQNYNTRPVPPHPPQASQPPPPPPRPRAASTAPPPTLARLLTMNTDDIRALSIHALKDILFTNHVNAGQILEKSDLVAKVLVLIEDEKRERERQRQAEEREQLELMRREEERREQVRERALAAERERQRAEAETAAPGVTNAEEENAEEEAQAEMRAGDGSGENSPAPEADLVSSSPPKPTPEAPKAQGSAVTLERTGLCVICQDEEANIAIVDCGHMAMCRECSDLIMASSRECPLCRTRIVTEARLLRIFRT